MQHAMRVVFGVYPEVRIKVYVDDKTFKVQSRQRRSSDKCRN